jgi:hypothetical protein
MPEAPVRACAPALTVPTHRRGHAAHERTAPTGGQRAHVQVTAPTQFFPCSADVRPRVRSPVQGGVCEDVISEGRLHGLLRSLARPCPRRRAARIRDFRSSTGRRSACGGGVTREPGPGPDRITAP